MLQKTLLIMLIFIIIFACSLSAQEDSHGATGGLKVIITGFKNEKGKAPVALFNNKENYDVNKEPFRSAIATIKNKRVEIVFEDLPFGDYAIKVFHDENDDLELDKNFLGMPTENYGFSNNARGMFGPASWQDAKFELNNSLSSMEIKVQ